MILVMTIIMIIAQSTPTIAPVNAPLQLLSSQGAQPVVYNYKIIMYLCKHAHTGVATY